MKLIVRGVVCDVKPGVLFVFISYSLYQEMTKRWQARYFKRKKDYKVRVTEN